MCILPSGAKDSKRLKYTIFCPEYQAECTSLCVLLHEFHNGVVEELRVVCQRFPSGFLIHPDLVFHHILCILQREGILIAVIHVVVDLKYIAPEDIVVYSIDEVFIDATSYLSHYNMTAHDLAMTMIREVLYTTGITATAGIGTNLYLAKLAMDITAKHAAPDKDGVRIAELDEESFRYLLWDHKPLTDFWMTGPGAVKRLEKHGIHTMGELAYFSTVNQDILYKEFGVDAELLIDHAWGLEPCGMKEIKAYRPSTNSISEGQVLSCPYPYDKARIIVMEMADSLVLQLTDKGLVTDSLTLDVGYDRENCDSGKYRGPVHIDHYGRTVPKGAHGSTKLDNPTNLGSILISATTELFERIADKTLTVRRITIAANRVVKDEGFFQVDLFTDTTKLEKEKKLQNAMLGLKKKFGKNAVLKGTNYLDGATMRERNKTIGGHKAEYTSIWMVFLFPLTVHTAKCFLILSYPITPVIMFSLFSTS